MSGMCASDVFVLLGNGLPLILLFVMAAGVAVLVYLLVGAQARRRTEALSTVAEGLGFAFEPAALGPGDAALALLPLFMHGCRRQTTNLMRYEDAEREEAVFDYRYTVGSGKNASTHDLTVVALRVPALVVPVFELRPENMFHRIGSLFGYQDIDFVDHPKFSREFLLRGPDEHAIRDFFTEPMIDVMEQRPGICVEAGGAWFIVYREGKRCKPEDVAAFLVGARELRDLFAAPHRGARLR